MPVNVRLAFPSIVTVRTDRIGQNQRLSESMRVMGVDACKKGWVGVTSDGRAHFAKGIAQLVDLGDAEGRLRVIAIDIPIGLPIVGERKADREARAYVKARRNSVFITPVRGALEALAHAEGSSINRAADQAGMTQQAYGLRTKIFEVAQWAEGDSREWNSPTSSVSLARWQARTMCLTQLRRVGRQRDMHEPSRNRFPGTRSIWAGSVRRFGGECPHTANATVSVGGAH